MELSDFDNKDLDKPSTHASVQLFSQNGVRLARFVTFCENIERVAEHYKGLPEVWAIQFYISRSKLIGNTPCLSDPETTHHVWSDRVITDHKTPAGGWVRTDSIELEMGCPYVLQAEDGFEKFKALLQERHEAQQRFVQALTPIQNLFGDAPEREEDAN